MRVAAAGRPHLTYCTNIHPGESWPEVFANLGEHVLAVKRQVAPHGQFGVGLRLSAKAALELATGPALDELRAFLDQHRLYVFTLNGFPYGAFHGTCVKERVYSPDWLEPARLRYSDLLAWLLARLVPDWMEGSVSTLPGAFKPRVEGPGAEEQIAGALLQHAATLHEIFEETGKRISLGLEPEPHCQLETVAETIAFFEARLFSPTAIARFSALTGLDAPRSETFLRHHLGVCFDACHMSVEFEGVRAALQRLRAAGIRVVKFQISAGLKVAFDADPGEVVRALEPFADPIYLHQVVERRDAARAQFLDLKPALATLATAAPGRREWRIHFHVPLFLEGYGRLGNTQDDLRELLGILKHEEHSPHLEVETYTWDVLPPEYRRAPIAASIARELHWVKAQLER